MARTAGAGSPFAAGRVEARTDTGDFRIQVMWVMAGWVRARLAMAGLVMDGRWRSDGRMAGRAMARSDGPDQAYQSNGDT